MFIKQIVNIAKKLPSCRFSTSHNLYQTLGVTEDSSFKEIKEKYVQKSKVMHPDQSSSAFTDEYHRVQQAYKILVNPDQRKKYDLSLGIRSSPW